MDTPPPPSSARWTLDSIRNPNTLHVIAESETRLKARGVPPDEAYRLAVGLAVMMPAPPCVGYRLFWAREGGACGCLEIAEGDQLVIGRHDRCDLVLDDERNISLRHVLVRVSRVSPLADADAGLVSARAPAPVPVLHLLDLQTTAGFALSDGSPQRCVVGTGPIVFRIGHYAIAALPNGMPLETSEAMPAPVVDCAETNPYKVNAQRIALVPRASSPTNPHLDPDRNRVGRQTRITSLPRPRPMVEMRPIEFADDNSSGNPGESSSAAANGNADHYRVVLDDGRRSAAIRLTEPDLERGVLLGRDGKCVDAGLREVLTATDRVSRVHALIIRDEHEGDVVLYDTGSTNGTFVDGSRVRSVSLRDNGTDVFLAARTDNPVRLHWRRA